MNLVISSVHGHGDQTKEYVQLDAAAPCQLGQYLLADSTYVTPTAVSNLVRNTHWFLDQQLNRGDTVLLHTRSGTNSKVQRPNGTIVYHVFWGLARPVWNNTGDMAVLMHIDDWKAHKVK